MSNRAFDKIKNYNLAIDGPTGSGKSTCGKLLSKSLNLKFLETGEIYRLFTFFLKEKKIDWNEWKLIASKEIKNFNIKFNNNSFQLNGQIISAEKLYTLEIENKTRLIASLPIIRKKITRICQKIINSKNFLLVGRDTTTVIDPNAAIKIFLDASPETQAKRKKAIFENSNVNWQKIIKATNKMETERKKGALIQVSDALYFRNEYKSPEITVKKLIALIKEKIQLLPKVAIIGNTNVGKSSLFNFLAERKMVITSRLKHTTRDQFHTILNWEKQRFILIDSGGYIDDKKNFWKNEINQRTQSLIQKADVVLWVINVKENLGKNEQEIKRWLKTAKKKTILVLNKTDSLEWEKNSKSNNWKQLGIFDTIYVSSLNKIGLEKLQKTILNLLPKNDYPKSDLNQNEKRKNIIILGQTNSGKSSLFNLLNYQQQALVSNLENTTTNNVVSNTLLGNQPVTLIDTAGMRKKNKNKSEIEIKVFQQIQKYLKYCDLALIIFDLNKGPTVQDKKIVNSIIKLKKSFLILGNKKDLLKDNWIQKKQDTEYFWSYLKKDKKIIYLSVKKKLGISDLLQNILKKIKSS